MVVSVLTKLGPARQHNKRSSIGLGQDDGAHSRVPHNDIGLLETLFDVLWVKKCSPAKMPRRITLTVAFSDLSEDLVPFLPGTPVINSTYKPVKRELSAHSEKNQITDPSYRGP